MEKQQLIDKTTEVLRPFETENLLHTIQTLTLKQLFSNPVMLAVVAILLFLGVYKRSKTILLSLFLMIGLVVIMRFAMPAPGEELTLTSLGPFIGIGIVIGGVIIYFSLVKSD